MSSFPMKGCKILPMLALRTFEQGEGSKSSLSHHTCFDTGPRSHLQHNDIPLCVVRSDWMGRFFGWDQENRVPMLQQVWHNKDLSLLKCPEHSPPPPYNRNLRIWFYFYITIKLWREKKNVRWNFFWLGRNPTPSKYFWILAWNISIYLHQSPAWCSG